MQRLVAVDVRGRDGGLLAEVREQVAVLGTEGCVRARHGDGAGGREADADRRGKRPCAVLLDGDDAGALDRLALRLAEHRGQRVGAPARRRAAAAARRGPRSRGRPPASSASTAARVTICSSASRSRFEAKASPMRRTATRSRWRSRSSAWSRSCALAMRRSRSRAMWARSSTRGQSASGAAGATRGDERRHQAQRRERGVDRPHLRLDAQLQLRAHARGEPLRARRPSRGRTRAGRRRRGRAAARGRLRGSCQPAATRTSAGPSACTALPPHSTRRSRRARPSATSTSVASPRPATTRSGTTGAGASAKSGTRNSWVGTV